MLGTDFPNNLIQFEEMFATEEKCLNHLFKARFPDGFICSTCGSTEFWWTQRQLLHCKHCGHQTSLRKGTVFEGSKKPLKLWYRAIFLVAFQKIGISAKNLQQQLGFSSYQTAWAWLHKIRLAMRRLNREKLIDKVEVDESFIGGHHEGQRGRGSENKTLLCIGLERDTSKKKNQCGRIRIEIIDDASKNSIEDFIIENVDKEAIVVTDKWPSYNHINELIKKHLPQKSDKENDPLGGIHLVSSLLKRWLLGTHQGRVEKKHLQQYVDEFVFRFNRRKSKSRGKVFFRLIDECIVHTVKPYWQIIGREAPDIPLGFNPT
jgi:transposase-like protein